MHRKANNCVNGVFVDKGEPRVVLLSFGAKQATLRSRILQQICGEGATAGRQTLLFGPASFRRQVSAPPPGGGAGWELNGDVAARFPPSLSPKAVVAVGGLELLSLSAGSAAAEGALTRLVRAASERGLKAVIVFCCRELIGQDGWGWLSRHAQFKLEFAPERGQARAWQWDSRGLAATESLAWSAVLGRIAFEAPAAAAKVPQAADPDDLFNASFKLGLTATARAEKEKLVLPHYKEKQLQEMGDWPASEEEADPEHDEEEGLDL